MQRARTRVRAGTAGTLVLLAAVGLTAGACESANSLFQGAKPDVGVTGEIYDQETLARYLAAADALVLPYWVWGALIAAVWLRVPITRSIALGLCCGLAGVVLLVGNGVALSGDAGWLPVAAGLIAPVCYAIASTYTKAFPSTTTPFANTQGSMWMAGLVCLPVLFFVPIRQTPQVGDWAALAALGVFCTGIAYLMYFRLIQDVGPTKALSVTFLIPVFGVLWGALFLNEAIGWDKLSGGVLVLAGISLTTGIVKLPSRRSA